MFRVVALAVAVAAVAIALGPLEVPLPFPAVGHRVVPLPEDKIPGPPRPLEGPLAPNSILKDHAVRLFDGTIFGSESVAQGPGDSITMLDHWGYVWAADPAEQARTMPAAAEEEGAGTQDTGLRQLPASYSLRPEPVAYIGPGRPLGFRYDAAGNLIVCDGLNGLVMVGAPSTTAFWTGNLIVCDSLKGLVMLESPGSPTQRLTVLANRASPSSPLQPGSIITYANDLDIDPRDGTVYFTDCQNITTATNTQGFYDTMWSFLLGLFSGLPSGRLLAYHPSNSSTHVLATGIWYANGVALSADGSFVAVVETNMLRVLRVWIKGPKAGTTDVLIDGLPGFPDGLSRASDGNFWVAIIVPRSPIMPKYIRYKLVRSIGAWLPSSLRPKNKRQGLVLKVSPEGQLLGSFWDVDGERVVGVSAVEEHQGRLWLGNLGGSGVSYVDVGKI